MSADSTVSFMFFLHFDIHIFLVLVADVKRLLVSLHVIHHIDISPVDVFQDSLVGIDTDTHGLVDASNFNSVTRSDVID